MNKENLLTDVYLWEITGELTNADSKEILTLHVQAESMEYAMEAVRLEYPNIRFRYCRQEQEINMIIE